MVGVRSTTQVRRRRLPPSRLALAPLLGVAVVSLGLAALAPTQGGFSSQTSNSGTALNAGLVDAWVPTAVSASRSTATSCLVSWTAAPSARPGTTYDVTDGMGTVLASAVAGTSATVSVPVSSVTPTVKARYALWVSGSATAASAPCAGWPDAPVVTATAADGQITATWTAPADNGSAITGYTATTTPATTTCTVVVPATQSCTFTGLTNGATYTVSVRATSGAGTGPAGTATAIPYPSAIMTAARLRLWLDGADPATLVASSTCTGALATAGVGCWKDKSTSANHFTQSTSSDRPTLSSVNARSVPTFDGTGDFLSGGVGALPTGTAASTSLVVARLTDPTPTSSGYRVALSWGSVSTGTTREVHKPSNDDVACANTYGSGAACPGPWRPGMVDILAGQHASAAVTAWLNGGGAAGPVSYAFSTGTTGATIGAELAGVQQWMGPIPEVIVFTGVLTAGERRTVQEYLARKWGGVITPGAPTAVTGTAGNAQATVSWTAPAWNGGAAITSYTATASPGGATCTATPPATGCTVTGLTNGTTYTFTVTAANAAGTGPASSPSPAVSLPLVPAKLAFTTPPAGPYTVGAMINVSVAVQDANGATVTTDSSSVVTLAIATNPGGGSLSCTNPGGTSVVAASGVAGFSCSIDTPGSGYTLTATSGSLTPATSAAFTVTSNALTYGGLGPVATRTSSGTATVTYPASTAGGDLLLLVEVNSANQNISTPSGWTLLSDQATGSPSQARTTVWWKLAAAGETFVNVSVNTNASGANLWVARYSRPTGYPPNPSHATASDRSGLAGATSTLTPAPDVTTSAAQARAISVVTARTGTTLSLATPRGFTLRATAQNSSGQGVTIGIADMLVPTSGTAPASPTWSQSGTPAQWSWSTTAFS